MSAVQETKPAPAKGEGKAAKGEGKAAKGEGKKGEGKGPRPERKQAAPVPVKPVTLDAKGNPVKPNKEEFEARIEAVQTQIEAKKEEIAKVIKSIDEKSTGKEEYDAARTALFDQLSSIKTTKEDYFEQKQELIKAGRSEREEAFQAKRKLQDMEKAGKDMNEESIDQKIAQLEYELNVRPVPITLKEEKEKLMTIKKLRAQRPAAIKHTRELEALKAGAAAGGATAVSGANREETIQELNKKLDASKEEKQKISDQLDELKKQRDGKLSNLKPLIEKRQALRDDVSALIEQKKAIVEERKAGFDAYKKYQDQVWEERKAREQAEWDSWRAEQAAHKAQQELEAPNPFLDEVTLLEQTIDYCDGLLPKVAEKSEEKVVDFNNPEGTLVMASKKDRAGEMYMSGTKGKRGKKAPKEDNDGAAAAGLLKKAIRHTAETFATFKTLAVKTPMTVGDLVPLREELKSKLQAVNDKVSKWEQERIEKVQKAKEAAEKGEEVAEEKKEE